MINENADDVMFEALYGAVFMAVEEAGDRVVNDIIWRAVYWAVEGVVWRSVDRTIEGVVVEPAHPNLGSYLMDVGL